jgi:prolyl-tRNA synthetase
MNVLPELMKPIASKQKINGLISELRAKGLTVKFDDDDQKRPGWKFAEYEAKGVPVRIAVGLRDLENNQVEVARRDTQEKKTYPLAGLSDTVSTLLDDIQNSLFDRALAMRNKFIQKVDSYDDFKKRIETEGGFFSVHWDGTKETEEKIKADTKATIRCMPLDAEEEKGTCMVSGKPSNRRVLIAKAY